jgi:hypothetical protein
LSINTLPRLFDDLILDLKKNCGCGRWLTARLKERILSWLMSFPVDHEIRRIFDMASNAMFNFSDYKPSAFDRDHYLNLKKLSIAIALDR